MMDLAEYLGIPIPYAAGLMESLWHWVARCHRTGDLTGVRPIHIAQAIRYPGPPDRLWEALVKARWVDVGDFGARIHDWSEHADDTTHRYLKRKGLNFCDGVPPYHRNRPHSDEMSRHVATKTGQSLDMSRPPVPVPVPEPVPVARVNTETLEKIGSVEQSSSSNAHAKKIAKEFGESLKVAREKFAAAADEKTIERIVEAVTQTNPGITDAVMADAMRKTFRLGYQKSPMLWASTIPTWLQAFGNGNGACATCRGRGMVEAPWVDRDEYMNRPEPEKWIPCPEGCEAARKKAGQVPKKKHSAAGATGARR